MLNNSFSQQFDKLIFVDKFAKGRSRDVRAEMKHLQVYAYARTPCTLKWARRCVKPSFRRASLAHVKLVIDKMSSDWLYANKFILGVPSSSGKKITPPGRTKTSNSPAFLGLKGRICDLEL